MAPADKFLRLLNCTVRFSNSEGIYEGVIRQVFPTAEIVVVSKITLLPDHRMGSLNFRFPEMENLQVISRPDCAKDIIAEKMDVLPVYPKTKIEKFFDFDEGSDIEDGDDLQAAYKMKVLPLLCKSLPRDFEIIDNFNKDFNLAIKHIRQQEAIGVSLEGINISRSGTLTWLCISTPCCNFLFDILALGDQAFKRGLKSILENGEIQKIFHDCRLPSDCLYHKFGVRLVNVFDTQVADFIVMMQMTQRDKIDHRVNTLDACLSYYLEVPYDYLYGNANFDEKKDSLNFHALRPLQHETQDVLIKNIMYLHLLKKELELALLNPLRRATEVYLNSIQKLKESELLVVPHKPDELPLDMHLEGIQIFRYKEFEYACSTVASGPPYREINNPIKDYLMYRAEYKNSQKKDPASVVSKHISLNSQVISADSNKKSSVNGLEARKSTSALKPVGVRSCDMSSGSDRECSDEAVECKSLCNLTPRSGTGSNTSTSQKSIVKSEASQCSEYSSVRNPIMRGMLELLSRTSAKNVKNAPNESLEVGQFDSQVSKESSMDNDTVMRDSLNTNNLSKSAATLPCSSNETQVASSQNLQPTLGRKSPSELLELISKMPSFNRQKTSDMSSDEHSSYGSIVDSGSVGKKSVNVQPVQSSDSVVEKGDDISDSELEDIAARVRARGILLRNQKTSCSTSDCLSTSDACIPSMEVKPTQKTSKNSSDVEPTSEEVTVYYSDVMDKPSQFVVKVNHKSSCLAELYKRAGDMSLLWTEEDSENVPKSSDQPTKSEDEVDFWTSVLGDRSCQPMDEKLRLRLIPAGMSGF